MKLNGTTFLKMVERQYNNARGHISSDRVFLGVTTYVHVFLDKSNDMWEVVCLQRLVVLEQHKQPVVDSHQS